MMFQAVLSNRDHPEYGQYAYCIELLEALEIGDAVKADCMIAGIDSDRRPIWD